MQLSGRQRAIRADLLDFTGPPTWCSADLHAVRWRPDHWLLLDGERIAGALPGDQPPGDDWQRIDHHRGRLLMPGFIDSHVHAPQLDVIGSHGSGLLDWLDTYTFPAERRFAEPAAAHEGAVRFLDALLAHGTTAAQVFATVHAVSADALFAAAQTRGMRLITGKVLMDRHAPDGLRDTDTASAHAACEQQIARWHGRGRNAFAVTVRFAATSTPQQLALAGALCRRDASLFMQTHVAETQDEVRWIAELFPERRSYLDVYDHHGLLHPRATLAHGIWLDDTDRAVLRDSGANIAHSPTSNLFLGSGLFDWAAAQRIGHRVTLASDVGGGTTLSMPRTLAAAYQVQALRGLRLSAWTLLHAATRGAAAALQLEAEIGHLDEGALADFTVWDWAHGGVARHRDAVAQGVVLPLAAQDLHARVFAWLTLADERNVAETFVAGQPRFTRDHTPASTDSST